MPTPSRPTIGITPSLIVRSASEAIAFYRLAFGAELVLELPMPDGRLGHAELDLFGGRIMLADEFPEVGCVAPRSDAGKSFTLSAYVDDVDAATHRAQKAGAAIERSPRDEFYGDRVAHLRDPFGHHWTLHTRIEDVSPDEMRRRMNQGSASDSSAS